MSRRPFGLFLIAPILLFLADAAYSQGVTTGTLRGRVTNEGAPLPGVTIAIKSPGLQGERARTTSANGDYVFVALPPGDYSVTFTLQAFKTVTQTVAVTTASEAKLETVMSLAGVEASASVVAKAETVSTGTQASTTITTEFSNKLPITRTILSEVALSSGVAQVNNLGNAFSISGGQTFDNLFTVDGAVIMDNVRGTPNNLFVEDAIQETTTTVNSVSAEFGRFTGGVVNTVTKSGGNQFSGSFRTTLTNDAWTAITPSKETRIQTVNPRYEATLGGPIWKDHVWFFGSGRLANVTGSGQTAFTNISYQTGNDEKRYQGKLTLTPVPNQTLTGSYLKVDQSLTNDSYSPAATPIEDLDSLINRQLPQEILTANYNGVISSNFFVEGAYSRRKFSFENSGSTFTDLVKGTLLRDKSRGNARYNSPTFCGVCDPEARDNREFQAKGTYFLSTPSLGSHNVVLGYDNFSGSRKANNYQSGSNYRIFTTGAIFQNNDIFPVITPTSYVYYTPIDTLSKGTDTLTHSVFLNDSWRFNDRLSFNLGVRWDKNNAADSRGVVTSKDSAFSPRVAAAFDATGSGTLKLGASYAKYVGAIQDNLVDSASNAGVPSTYIWYISGAGAPVINSPATSTLTTRAAAIQQVFNWFFAQNCPAIATCKLPLAYALVSGLSTAIPPDGLKSPHANEYTFGVNGSTGAFSYRADFVRREFKDFYFTNLNISTGKAADPVGNFYDVGIQGNTNDLTRNYTALQTQFQYRLFNNRLNLAANWTWSHTIGNTDGEAGNTGPTASTFRTYPEYKQDSWFVPKGDLATDQRHRVRVFATYDLPFIPQSIGLFSLSAVQAYDTGAPYGAVGLVRSRLYVTNPGYVTRPTSVAYYYTARDAFRTDNIKRTDLALNYSTKIGGLVEIFIQPQITNLFNNQGKVGVNTTVRTAASAGGGSYADFNPFTTTPRQGLSGTGANWDYARNADGSLAFGTARNALDYQNPRTYQATMGIRF